ncbi:MAG: hypothetical protein JJD96_05810 [Thermoleophilia bacterium]|nr:hypothetical protein [Thermoleophilia bacterium]
MSEALAGFALLFFLVVVPLVFFGGFIFLVIRFILKKNKQHREEMVQAASQMGAVYTYLPQPSIMDSLDGFRFNQHQGQGRMLSNLFELERNGVPWKILDYSYDEHMAGVGSGPANENHITRYSAVAVAQPTFGLLPGFVLFKGQANLFDKLRGEGGGIVVDDPVFEKTYTLDGADQKRVYEFFGPEIIEYFVQPAMVSKMKNLIVESDSRNFVLYKSDGGLSPFERSGFLDQAEEILNLLVKQAQQQK